MKNRYAFTLVEVLISIILFSLIVLFLYQALDMTKKTNQFFSKKVEKKLDINRFKKMLFLDLINKKSKIEPFKDRRSNNYITFKTTNIYHNPFYENVTYLVSKEKNLIRIESKDKFDKNKLTDNFFDTAYISIILNDIEKFYFKEQKNGKFTFYIKTTKKDEILFGF